jgi:hypothetical protein
MPWTDPNLWNGLFAGGGGLIGLLAARLTGKQSRASQLEQFKDELFKEVREELEECKQGHARMLVAETGLRLLWGEAMRTNPHSQALRMCGDLIRQKLGPVQDTPAEFAALLDQLDNLPKPEDLA